MSAQRILPFPCRKPRSLAAKLSSVSGKSTSPGAENHAPRKTLNSVSNLRSGNPGARSIMQRPRSPRKKSIAAHDESSGGWTGEDILNAILKLSPCSPIQHMREKLNFDMDKMFKTPLKKASFVSPINDHGSNVMSPTRAILSPIRALSLNSPGKQSEDQNLDAKRSKVLRLKLSRISQPTITQASDETPSKSRASRRVATATPAKSRKENTAVDKTPADKLECRRVTRSARKAQKIHFYDGDDEEKENIKPADDSPSPRKKSRPSPELQRPTEARRTLLTASPGKARSTPRSSFDSKNKSDNTAVEDHIKKDFRAVEKDSVSDVKQQELLSPAKRLLQLHRPEGLIYQETKRALHSSVPDQLVGREEEISKISKFISSNVTNKESGSLYISGAPGTGKSACLMKVLGDDKVTGACSGRSKVVSVNCMSMRNSTAIYAKIAMELGAKPSKCKTSRSAMKYLETALTSEGPSVILLLDEMDQLDSKNQEVLYTIFEWPALNGSRLLLIGIANALDLTDRILPRLQARSICKPTLINFRPYTKDQIVAILEARIKQTSNRTSERVLDAMAVQFCARKVAAVAGDARKALDVCRRAVEVVETGVMSQHVLSPSQKHNGMSSAPLKKVGLAQISGVIAGVYESSISSRRPASSASVNDSEEENFPLQQKLAVCTLILLSRYTKCKEVTLGKLHESYAKICKKRQVTGVGQSEFVTLLQLIETRGIISTKATKQIRMMKISLALQEKDVEYALRDKTLLSAILQEGIPK